MIKLLVLSECKKVVQVKWEIPNTKITSKNLNVKTKLPCFFSSEVFMM